MMRYLQKVDEQKVFKRVRLLEKGYEQYVNDYGDGCVPRGGYVSMFNKHH